MTVALRGPANPDAFRIEKYRSRYYLDNLPADELRPEGPMTKKTAVPSMSFIKSVESKDGLIYWAAGEVAKCAVDERETWQRMERDAAVDYVKGAHTRAKNKAAKRGHNIHEQIERRMRGESDSIWDEIAGTDAALYVPAVEAYLADLTPEMVYAECVAFGDGYGGTLDVIKRYPTLDGQPLAIVDYKTRRAEAKNPHTVYAGEVCQIGGYADARYLIIEIDGQARRVPVPELDVGILVTFTPDRYVVHPIDLTKARESFRAMHAWSKGMKVAEKSVGAPLVAQPVAAVAAAEEAAAPAVDDTVPIDVDAILEELRPELVRRLTKLIEAGHDKAITSRWPAGVGRLSEVREVAALAAIDAALTKAEAEVGMPFDPPPVPPAPKRPEAVRPPEPVKPHEGGTLQAHELDELRAAWSLMTPDQAEWIEALAKGAGNLSLSELRSERRLAIGWSIVRLAVAGWHDDQLLAAVIDHTYPPKAAVIGEDCTAADVLAVLTATEAKQLSTTVDQVVDGSLTFSVADGGEMRLTAA